MIKDKITPQIKDRFRDALKRTIEAGKEHSFNICKDRNGNLYPRDICVGEECGIQMESASKCFPDRSQGNFHTHADMAVARRTIGDMGSEFLTTLIKDAADFEGVDVTTPSHGDLVNALINKCIKRTEGTVCVGSDSISDRVDCWTAKDNIHEDDCEKAMTLKMMGLVGIGTPKPWIKPLFNKEIIEI